MTISAFDHVSLPMLHTDSMLAFYRALGLTIAEHPSIVSVYVGNQMINFHRPELWQRGFDLRARAAQAPCGDLCFVWEGTGAALHALLDGAGAEIIEGPVEREGGRRATATSVYVRDPDGNLLEFMIYGEEHSDAADIVIRGGTVIDGSGAPGTRCRCRDRRRRDPRDRAEPPRRRSSSTRRAARSRRVSSTSTRTTTRRCSGIQRCARRRTTVSRRWWRATAASRSRRPAPSTAT